MGEDLLQHTNLSSREDCAESYGTKQGGFSTCVISVEILCILFLKVLSLLHSALNFVGMVIVIIY
jgi:hypothetical protein